MTSPSAPGAAGSGPAGRVEPHQGTGEGDALPGALAVVAGQARAAARDAHREIARLQRVYLDAEEAFIADVAEAHRAGRIDWGAVYEAYREVREWSQLNGLPAFLERWQRHIPISALELGRLADSVSAGEDPAWSGQTWSGETGWEGLERGGYPPNGVHVAFVLFDDARAPVRYGVTSRFKTRTGRMHKNEGLRWSSWQAHRARDADDARAQQAALLSRYGHPETAGVTGPRRA